MKNILCFGDSNTWGYYAGTFPRDPERGRRFPFEVRWPGRLQLLLGEGYRVVEDGLNGRTISMTDPLIPYRRGLDFLPAALDAQGPLDLVILALGCNEWKEMFNLSADMIARGLEMLIAEARQSYHGYPAPQVLVLAPAPMPDEVASGMLGPNISLRSARVSRETGPLFREVAERNGCAFLDCGDLGLELNETDHLHYCAGDHGKVAETLAPMVRELLAAE